MASEAVYHRGDGIGAYIRATNLDFYPTSGLMYGLLLVSVFGFAFLVVEESLIGAALAGGLGKTLVAQPGTLSWVIGSISFGAIAAYPLGGPLSDKIGRRRLIIWGLIGYVVADILQMTATNIWAFMVGRVLSGAVGMFTIVPALAIVRDLTPRMNRGMGYGIATGLGWGGGALLSFWIGSPILRYYSGKSMFGLVGDWRWVFFYAGIFALFVAVIEWLFLKDLHPRLRLRQRGLELESEEKLREIEREERGSVTQAVAYYFKSWRMWIIWSNQWFWGIAWTGILTFLPVILTTALHESASTASFVSGFVWVAYIISALFIGWFIDHFHARKIVNMAGMLGVCLTMMFFALYVLNKTASVGEVILVLLLIGVFAGAQYPPFATVLAGEAEAENPAGVASAFAFYMVSATIVNFLPQFMFPRISAGSGGWESSVVVMGLGALCSLPTLLAARGPLWPRRTFAVTSVEEYY